MTTECTVRDPYPGEPFYPWNPCYPPRWYAPPEQPETFNLTDAKIAELQLKVAEQAEQIAELQATVKRLMAIRRKEAVEIAAAEAETGNRCQSE